MRDMRIRRFNFSVDLDYAFFYPDLSGAWKAAYEQASEWLLEYLDRNRKELWTDTFQHVMDHVKQSR